MERRRAGLGRLAVATFAAGLAGAIVEMVPVLPIQAMVLHNPPQRVFQAIAMGAIGRQAFAGGWATAVQGMFWHTLISWIWACAFVLVATRYRELLRRPIASGVALGTIAYVVMIFVVIPLSAIGFALPKPNGLTLLSFSIHLLAFGVPIGLVSRAVLGPGDG